MIEGLQLSIPHRLSWIKTILIVSLLVSVILSFNLWISDRNFPMAPIAKGFHIPVYLHYILISLLILFWLAALLMHYQRVFIVLSLLLSIVMISLDLNRLQPWFYIYLCMLCVFVSYNGRVDNSNTYTSYLVILQLILASVYFFNGVSIFNPYFTETAFTEIIQPLRALMSERQFHFFIKAGRIMPYVLIFIGLGLSLSRIRYLAITLAIIFHLILLVLLFPSSSHANYALWMSNLTFLVILLLLFSGSTKQKYFSPVILFQRFIFYPVLLFLLIMPFFNSFGLWPDFLSSNIKSGNNVAVKLSISETAYTRLPEHIKPFCIRESFAYSIDYQAWCQQEVNAECFPDKRVFGYLRDYVIQITKVSSDEVNLDQVPKHKILLKR